MRWRITLACIGLVVAAGVAVALAVRLFLPWLPERTIILIAGNGFADQRADVLTVSIPLIVLAVSVMLLVALIGGWLVAGRILAPVAEIGAAARVANAGSLHHRVALPGPDDELRRLADTVDAMLARLERSFDEQRRFTANASHQLRTPLSVTHSLLEIARADPAGRDVDVLLARLAELNDRSTATLDALLALARAERADLPRQPLDLAALAHTVLARTTFGTVTVHPDLTPVLVRGHPALLEQLVANLVDNAVVHNRAGGQIWLRVGPAGDGAQLQIANTGAELDPVVVGTLLEPFVRGVGRVRSGDGPAGSGLGLAVVAAVAAAHRGRVDVAARAGGGLMVWVGVPR